MTDDTAAQQAEGRPAPTYLIANQASDGRTMTFRRPNAFGAGWTPDPHEAERWPSIERALTALTAVERDPLNRAGRRLIIEEISTGSGLAHREITSDEPDE